MCCSRPLQFIPETRRCSSSVGSGWLGTERGRERGRESEEWRGQRQNDRVRVPTWDVIVGNTIEEQLSSTLQSRGGSRGVCLCVTGIHLIMTLTYCGSEILYIKNSCQERGLGKWMDQVLCFWQVLKVFFFKGQPPQKSQRAYFSFYLWCCLSI